MINIKRKSPTSAQSTITHRMGRTGTVLYGFTHYNIECLSWREHWT